MPKHLIIGLGGTGGNVICELRKRIFEEYRSEDPQVDKTFVDYLYVDSSKEDLLGVDKEGKHVQKFDEKWQTIGHSVALSPAQTLFIGGLEKEKLTNLHLYNNINSFYTEQDRDDTIKGLDNIISDGIGGQRRRFGRMLFANNITSENNFCNRVRARVDNLLKKGKDKGDSTSNVTFHICAGLAGGTGSGTIIDTVSQIRKMYPQHGNPNQYRICLYLYIPESQKNPDRDKEGFYRPNGYAALSELNALSLGVYMPVDVTDTRDLDGEEKRIQSAGFEAAYVYTNRSFATGDASGNQYGFNELSKIVADFMFQKLLTGISARFESNENVNAGPEEDTNGTPVHSRKFLSFGIKRLIYPEQEIQEYAAYKFAYTAAMQMVWGWPKGATYPMELSYDQVNVSANEVDGSDDFFAMRQTLNLTDTRLTIGGGLAKGKWDGFFKKYLETAKKAQWTSVDEFWKGFADKLYSQIVGNANLDKNLWVSRFQQEMQKQYSSYFRGNGVEGFYANCTDDKAYLAQESIDSVSAYLLGEWKEGRRSLAEVEKFLDLLIEACRKRYSSYDDTISRQLNIAQKKNQEANALAQKFAGRGLLSDLLSISTKTFEQYKNDMRDRYIAQTQKVAYTFAKVLMDEIIKRLVTLRDQVHILKESMIAYIKTSADLANAKCQIGDGGYRSDAEVVKLYNPDDIRKLVEKFVHEEEKQKDGIFTLRQTVVNAAGDKHFAGLAERCASTNFLQTMLDNPCRDNARERITDYATENRSQKVLDMNVLEKLRAETDWEEIIEKLCRDALILIERNGNEVNADNLSTSMVQFGLPEFKEDEDFRKEVLKKVKDYLAGEGYTLSDDDVYETTRGQMVMMTGKVAFSLRYIQSVRTLKEEYDKFIKDDICRQKLIHTESFSRPLPSLFNKSSEELKVELYRVLPLLYTIPGLVAEEENKETGEKQDAVAKKEKNGRSFCYNRLDRPDDMASGYVFLGKGIREALSNLSKREGDVSLLVNLVEEELKNKYKRNDKKEELTAAIKKFIKEVIGVAYDNDTMNREFRAFVRATDALFEKELKLK